MIVRLIDLAHARSGDKGDSANIGVIARRPEYYPILERELTANRVRSHFAGIVRGEVERFEHLPTDDPPRVAASINLSLVRAEDRNTLVSRRYSGEEPVGGDTPDTMAEAFNRLTSRLMAEVVRDLQTLKPRLGALQVD